MLYQALLIAASAALASAQITYNGSQIICPADKPNGSFCAGDSLSTNIIIRCVNGVAGPGNCNDNLAGDPPVGVSYSQCWQTSLTSGDAACAKNCVVYCGSGSCTKGNFNLPNCTPSFTASSSTASSTATTYPTSSPSSTTSSSLTTSTYTTVCTTGSTTTTQTFTTTFCPTSSTSMPNNTTYTATSQGQSASPTKTPSSPATSAPSGFTGAAATLSPMVGSTLAGVGLMVAYFL